MAIRNSLVVNAEAYMPYSSFFKYLYKEYKVTYAPTFCIPHAILIWGWRCETQLYRPHGPFRLDGDCKGLV